MLKPGLALFKLACLFLLAACGGTNSSVSAEGPPPGWQVQAGQSGATVFYSAPGAEATGVLSFPVAALDEASGGNFSELAGSQPRAQLEYALSVFALDFAEIEGERRIGDDFAIWGRAEGERGEEAFALRLQPGDTPPSIAMLRASPEQFAALDGVRLITAHSWPMGSAQLAEQISGNRPRAEAVPERGAREPHYTPPIYVRGGTPDQRWPNWVFSDAEKNHGVAAANDPRAPRIDVDFIEAASPQAALRRALQRNEVRNPRHEPLEPLEVVPQVTGGEVHVSAGRSRLGGADAALFVLVERTADQSDWKVFVFQAPEETWRDWGGVGRMLLITGVIEEIEAIPAERRDAIARLEPAQQVVLYEAAYTQLMLALLRGTLMSQAQTTMMMQELNYDLLFGDDITSPFPAD